MEVRALRVVMIPALAMEMVCCSCKTEKGQVAAKRKGRRQLTMTSCRTLRVASDILSNSSMQQMPPSERTRAPLREGRGQLGFEGDR